MTQQVTVKSKSFGEKMASYLQRRHEDKDVTFIVGPSKEKIQALKIGLKAASPEMEMFFDQNWNVTFSREAKEGIPLPGICPQAFKIFLEILFSDDWSVEQIEALKLPLDTVFNLIKITKQFNMTGLEVTFSLVAQNVYKDFVSFSSTEEFLELSSSSLEAIFSSKVVIVKETAIFASATRWAKSACTKLGIKNSGENMRKVLGGALFDIRFPLMSTSQFADLVSPTEILTEKEELQVYRYIAQSNYKLIKRNESPFSSKSRVPGVQLTFNSIPYQAPTAAEAQKIPATRKKPRQYLNLPPNVTLSRISWVDARSYDLERTRMSLVDDLERNISTINETEYDYNPFRI